MDEFIVRVDAPETKNKLIKLFDYCAERFCADCVFLSDDACSIDVRNPHEIDEMYNRAFGEEGEDEE